MKHIKSIIRFAALLLLMVCTQTVQAQTYIMVHKTDGNILRVAISDVDSVTFFEKQIDDLSYDYVDLGLSVKWATCNLGAKSPEEYGSFFAWGETIDKYEYTSNNYKWYDTNGMVLKYNLWKALGDVDMKYRLDADDDAAHVLLGDGWRIPTYENYVELFERCYWEPSEQNGVWGFNVTSSINNNSIFLPLTGMISEGDTLGIGRYAYYYTNTLNAAAKDKSYSIYSAYMYYNPYAYYYHENMASFYRTGGSPIRPVYEPNASFDNNVIEVQGVVVDQKEITLDVGKGWWLGAYVKSNSDLYILPMYSSDNDSVATVDSEGYLYGVSEGQCTITVSWGDYSETCVVTVIKRTYELTLSADSLIMYAGQSQELIAMLNSDELPGFHVLWYSSDTATVEVDGGFIEAKAIGSSVITAQYDSLFAECIVIVKAIENEPVDLGLSVMWGSMNLGAFSPEDIGGYYAWGETEEKEVYDKSNYKWYDNGSYYSINKYNLYTDQGVVDMKYRLDLEDDAAHVLLGDNWRIPTIEEFSELRDYCSWELIENTDGVVVYKVTSSINGNSIILPLSYYSSNTLGTGGGLSNYAYGLELDYQYSSTTNYLDRWYGLVIRPVYANTGYDNILEVTGLTMSQDTVFTEPGQGCQLYAYFNTNSDIVPSVRWHYYDEEVATVNNYGYVRVHGVGETKITASIGYDSAVCVVVVNEFVPVMEEVDLGLSVNWATCNIGSSRPEGAGYNFAWGEIKPNDYSNYDKWWSDSLNGFTKYGDIDGKYILDPEDDAANVIWGDGWRMPTYDELMELVNNCYYSRTSLNGMSGYMFTSRINGNSIFLPNHSSYGIPLYWTSSVDDNDSNNAWSLYYGSIDYFAREYPFSIRPVRQSESYSKLTLSADTLEMAEGMAQKITARIYGRDLNGYSLTWSSSDTTVASVSENGLITAIATGYCVITAAYDSLGTVECFVKVVEHEPFDEFVDLGLSVRWATCNIGAACPEAFGNYYAWGEIENKDYFSLSTYKWWSDSVGYTKYNNEDKKYSLDLDDDVAHVLLGGNWRIPTADEFYELIEECVWDKTTIYGVDGYCITGPNGNSIFLPNSGWYEGDSFRDDYDAGEYSTSDLDSESDARVVDYELWSMSRYKGFSVRPVLAYGIEDVDSVKIDRSEMSLALNSITEIDYTAFGANGKVINITEGLEISWTSDDESVAVVEDGVITAVGVGTCTITAIYGDYTSECVVTVQDPSQAEPEYVDLGLSVNWATFNVGAFTPEMFGDYFAWGETEPYYETGYATAPKPEWKAGKEKGYAWASYQWAEETYDTLHFNMTKYSTKDGKTVLDNADDVAAQLWGGDWRMPIADEFKELITLCNWEYVIEDGVKGYRITSNVEGYSDKSIFLPLAESRTGKNIDSDYGATYWSSTVAKSNRMYAAALVAGENDEPYAGTFNRYQGMTVRPVCTSDNWKGITSIELLDSATVLAIGENITLSVRALSGDEDYSFMSYSTWSWSSSDENVVAVGENGTIRAISEGSATITVEYNGLTSERIITVQRLSDIDPDRVLESYNKMYNILGAPGSCGYNRSDDYGLIMAAFSNDIEAADLFLPKSSYNWFTVCCELSREPRNTNLSIRYNTCYNIISAANEVIYAYDSNVDDQEVQAMIGEAYAIRAFAYLNLAPYYQVSYTSSADAKNLPCVPLLTLESDPNNNPRATVQEVYNQIVSDLSTAIDKLDGWKRSDKSRIDKQVAYGLRARAYLNMGMWIEAAADAETALAGYEPASIREVSRPFLYDISESNWMWGYDMNDSIASVYSYATSSSWLRSFSGDSYSAWGQIYSMINSDLYDMIPRTDVRKGWWVNENLYSPLLEGLTWDGLVGQNIASGYIDDVKEQFLPYTNVKFGMYYPGNTANDEDWCWMRAEEMVLIMVEGLAKSGKEDQASQMLTDFVQTYRDPSYDVNGRGLSLEDEIWFQRRVELWGEGFSNNDTRRLNKPLVRFHENRENNCPAPYRLNMSADNGWWLLRFPTAVVNKNLGIEDNTAGTAPVAGVSYGLMDGVTDYCDNGGGYDDEPYLSIYPRKLDMYAGDIYSLSFETNTGETVVWTSSDDNVATVDKYGVVTAVAEGHCTIAAIAGKLSAECGVVVMPEYHDTINAVYDFIISEDSLAAEFFYFEDCYGYEVSAEFGEFDSGVVCTSIICSITFSSADEAQEAYANMTKGLTDSFIDSLDVVFNDEGTGFSYTNPEMIGMDRDAVLARMYQSYNGMLNHEIHEEEYVEPGYVVQTQAYLPAQYSDSIAAWYLVVDEQENSVKYEAVFLYEYGDLVVTKSKFYTKEDGRDPEYEITAYGHYLLTQGNFEDGVASVILEDGNNMTVEIEGCVLKAMGMEYVKQRNDYLPTPMKF